MPPKRRRREIEPDCCGLVQNRDLTYEERVKLNIARGFLSPSEPTLQRARKEVIGREAAAGHDR